MDHDEKPTLFSAVPSVPGLSDLGKSLAQYEISRKGKEQKAEEFVSCKIMEPPPENQPPVLPVSRQNIVTSCLPVLGPPIFPPKVVMEDHRKARRPDMRTMTEEKKGKNTSHHPFLGGNAQTSLPNPAQVSE